jgi:hypothetical protein
LDSSQRSAPLEFWRRLLLFCGKVRGATRRFRNVRLDRHGIGRGAANRNWRLGLVRCSPTDKYSGRTGNHSPTLERNRLEDSKSFSAGGLPGWNQPRSSNRR